MIINSLAEMPISKLKRAIEIREQIDALTSELDQLTGGHQFISIHNNGTRLRGAQLNWPGHNGTNGHSGKTRLSAEGRAKVSAAVKARWARYRAAKARAARAK